MTLAERLMRMLDTRWCTVADAARAAGLSRQQVWKIASGVNDNPEVKTLERICGAVGGTLGELFADGD